MVPSRSTLIRKVDLRCLAEAILRADGFTGGEPNGSPRHGRLARAVDGLLRRADFSDFEFDRLLERIGIAERRELEHAHGRIEPRQRFQGGMSQPLGRRDRDYLFADESGTSRPDTTGKDPYFVLAAVSLTPEANTFYKTASARLKASFGIPAEKPFHEPSMRLREGAWGFGGNTSKQAEFDAAVLALLEETPFVAFGVAIRKPALAVFVDQRTDPYLPTDIYGMAIDLLMERYVDYLAITHPQRPLGRATFESQGASRTPTTYASTSRS